jgi:hypothetical protein
MIGFSLLILLLASCKPQEEILREQQAADEAAAAAEVAAASVAETEIVVAALAAAATNSMPVAGMSFNPYQNRDRNYDSGFGTQAPVTVNVTNTGSVIMQDEFVTAVTDAVTIGLSTGLKIKPPGSLPEFE